MILTSMVLCCKEAAQDLALTCQQGLFSILMKVGASSDSICSGLIDKAFCLVNKYQQIKKKAGGKLCGTSEETEQEAKRSEGAEYRIHLEIMKQQVLSAPFMSI